MNLARFLIAHAKGRPHHTAIVADAHKLSYAAVAARMLRLACLLMRSGIGYGDRVGLALRDSPDHLILHYAVVALGATVVPIDHRWTTTEKTAVASAFACRLVIVEPDEPGRAALPALVLSACAPDELPDHGILADDESLSAVLSLSSGTTGRPTGALVSHRELYERFVSQWAGMGFNGFDRYLLATPLYFGGGRSFAMSFLAAGGTVIFRPPPAEPGDIIETARAEAATVTFFVPAQIRRLLESWTGNGIALPGLRRLVTSGSAIAPHDRRRVIERLTPGLTDYYATSEGGGIAVLPPDEQLLFPKTVGRPAFGVEIEIVDAEGRRVPQGEIGRLRYRGPGVSSRLVDATGATVGAEGGWFLPGDLARILASGHVELIGRAKDVIIRGGINVHPAEIEDVLAGHEAIAEAAAFGLSDPDRGETVAAAVVVVPGRELEAADVQAYARERLAPYKIPERVFFVAALPRNSSGKVLRGELVRHARIAGHD